MYNKVNVSFGKLRVNHWFGLKFRNLFDFVSQIKELYHKTNPKKLIMISWEELNGLFVRFMQFGHRSRLHTSHVCL